MIVSDFKQNLKMTLIVIVTSKKALLGSVIKACSSRTVPDFRSLYCTRDVFSWVVGVTNAAVNGYAGTDLGYRRNSL